MGISRKRERFIHEYLKDLNASAAAVRAGYVEASARQTAYKILQDEEVQAEIKRLREESEMQPEDVILLLEKMAKGETPTKITEGSYAQTQYDMISAAEKMGKIFALFHDSVDLNIQHLNITDDDDG